MSQNSKSQQALFIEQWNIYQKVIANNYMFHAEIIAIVKSVIEQYAQPSILDLGCGDSYVVRQSLGKSKTMDYRGIDSSLPALEQGKASLKLPQGTINLINTDLLTELQTNKGSFDIILVGYSLHHLKTVDKQRCFAHIFRLLSDQGVFIFYDLEMDAREMRSAYIERACALFIAKWHDFDEAAMHSITTHVTENDIPENEQFYFNSFKNAGFASVNKVFKDVDNLFSVYSVKK